MSDANGRVVNWTPLRRAVANQMSRSMREAPHFFVSMDVDVTAAIEELHAQQPRVSLTALVVQETATTMKAFPRFNAVWDGETLIELSAVDVSVAVALDGGVLAPAVLDADGLSLHEIAARIADLRARAAIGKLRREELVRGGFTVSNLGMYGVSWFTAIITPPQVAVMAMGAARDERQGRKILTMTLSSDHRVIDGADAARFLGTVRQRIEDRE